MAALHGAAWISAAVREARRRLSGCGCHCNPVAGDIQGRLRQVATEDLARQLRALKRREKRQRRRERARTAAIPPCGADFIAVSCKGFTSARGACRSRAVKLPKFSANRFQVTTDAAGYHAYKPGHVGSAGVVPVAAGAKFTKETKTEKGVAQAFPLAPNLFGHAGFCPDCVHFCQGCAADVRGSSAASHFLRAMKSNLFSTLWAIL